MSAVDSEGPFRAPSPTPEAVLEKERRASLERVAVLCQAAVDRERRHEGRIDTLVFSATAAVLLGTGITLGLVLIDPQEPWLSFLCLASSLLVSAGIAVLHRSRVRHRRRVERLS